ncbi:HSF-type DNA-binding-domain-containing protein [Powellomyces hirtus]|nr:HSF-type DNA-binding-domain-containing protein [Powellomyces hirtus]
MCPQHHQDAGQPTVQNESHQQSFHHGLASGSEIDATSPAHGETPESIQKDTPPTQGIKSLPNSTEDAPTEESSGENATSTSSAPPNSSSTTISSGGVPDFVKKLFRMLEDNSESDIVGWGIHGDTFVVREPNEFAKTVLPRHFKHNNPASFVRQLNKYGFHKIRTQQEDGKLYGDAAWEFQHPNFQLNKKEMLESIRRKTTSKGKAVVTTVAAPTPITCNDMFATGLRKDTTDLQTQVDSLTKLQADIAGYLEGLSRNYRMVVEEVLNFRKNMAAQDQVIRSLVNYIAVKQSGDDAQKLFSNYQEVARASVHQMNEISKHVRQAYSMMHPQPTFGSSASSSAPPPTETPATAGLSTNGLPFAQSGAPSALLAASTGQLADFPFQTAQQGGLTVFTVGGFTPRREDPVGDSGQNAGTKSPRPPNSMRVTRATCVPPWSVPPKVLLVEDDITCRKLSSKLLQVVGCAFDVAVDGLDAVERMGVGTKYDIVLMDIVMPNLDGVTATNRIRQFDQFTPIISMTSNTTENDCITYLANGMNDILAKPFNKHSMLSMIERLVPSSTFSLVT